MVSVFYGLEVLNLNNMKEQFEKYSPKWLLHRILEAGDNHGEALMYILEFQRELIKNCTIPHVVGQSEQLSCPRCRHTGIDTDKDGLNYCRSCSHYWRAT